MELPVWYVPYLTAPMLIPLIAVPHVIVAQFAVGGGILLADLVRRAYRDHNPEALDYLHGLARYFVLITLVFVVQFNELMKWYDPNTAPIRGEWGSFALFMTLLVIALILIAWIGRTALRRTRNNAQNQFTN